MMRRTDDGWRRGASVARRTRIDLRLSLLRSATGLPWRVDAPGGADDRSPGEVLAIARAAAGREGAFVLGGGDPIGRDGIWSLLADVAAIRADQLGLATAGQRLTTDAVARLRDVGVQRVHVPFHCARQDAHDWLVGHPGALKAAHRAIRACVDGGLPVVAEVVVTRPTAPHLADTVAVLARIGVRIICVRRLTEADAPGPQFVTLAPRLALLEPYLELAAAVALESRVRLTLRDLPLCAASRLRPLLAPVGSEVWLDAEGRAATRVADAPGCPACPGAPTCAGAPPDYTQRFGWEEFADPAVDAARVAESVADQRAGGLSAPMVFSWSGPRRVRCATCGDAHPAAEPESTRAIRARLVQGARHRPAALRLVGADLFAHPNAAELIADAVRLFPHVEVAGEASAVAEWTDLDLRRLRELQRFDVALYGPDAAAHDAHSGLAGSFAATLRAAQRVHARANLKVGAYAILHEAREVPAYAAAWADGRLPGEPRFRLSASGSSLDALIEAARSLPAGRARAALLAVLPRCLAQEAGLESAGIVTVAGDADTRQIENGRSVRYDPCGSDPCGVFTPCASGAATCGLPGCPGRAIGWNDTERAQRWGSR